MIADDPEGADEGVDSLREKAEVGLKMVDGWRVVLAGRPNVGKSRLLNALAGYERAIVDPSPGTTRDVVTIRAAFDGWPVELADTAGLRASDDAIEAAGVASALVRQGTADLVVLVLDRSGPFTEDDRRWIASYPDALLVANKSDLPPAWDPEGLGLDVATVSAERGDGIEALASAIARRLVPDPPAPGSGVPFRPVARPAARRCLARHSGGRPRLGRGPPRGPARAPPRTGPADPRSG